MKNRSLLLAGAAALAAAAPAGATDRQLDTFVDPTGETVPIAALGGLELESLDVVGIFWDTRCAQVEYVFNSNVGANPGTPNEIDPATLAAVAQEGLDRWNDNPSSFIEMNITSVRDLGNQPRVGGDFVNEVTFITPPGFGALASSPSTSLAADTTFVAGDDLDGDGDSDVYDPAVEGVNKCTDIDEDGDIEFPAGFYKAGTILDNDVQFSSTFPWELVPTGGAAVISDVDVVSVHEFGHSHGINHAFINQSSGEDGRGSVMFPFIDVTDPQAELIQRQLFEDDLAISAWIYPEGSETTGIAALQPGDIAFDRAYDVIGGSVEVNGLPGVGANLQAITVPGDAAIVNTYAGKSRVFAEAPFDLDGNGTTTGLFAFDESLVDGDWEMPVPRRKRYRLRMEALDGEPAAAGNISINAIVGDIAGLTSFPEEGWNSIRESGVELNPAEAVPFFSSTPSARDKNLIANSELFFNNNPAVGVDRSSNVFIGATTNDVAYAEAFDRDVVLGAIDGGPFTLIGGRLETITLDASQVPLFDSVDLAVGRINGDGTATITNVLERQTDFVGQDGDNTPFVLRNLAGVERRLITLLGRDPTLQVFIVARAEDLVRGPSGGPPQLIGVDEDFVAGTSFISRDGGPFEPLEVDDNGTMRNGTYSIELRFVAN